MIEIKISIIFIIIFIYYFIFSKIRVIRVSPIVSPIISYFMVIKAFSFFLIIFY